MRRARPNAVGQCRRHHRDRRSVAAAHSAFRDQAPDQSDPVWSYRLDEAQINEQIGYC